jgi:hypothetical protein
LEYIGTLQSYYIRRAATAYENNTDTTDSIISARIILPQASY